MFLLYLFNVILITLLSYFLQLILSIDCLESIAKKESGQSDEYFIFYVIRFLLIISLCLLDHVGR